MPMPTTTELRDIHAALVKQLPNLATRWWGRVQRAVEDYDEDSLRLLFAEAQNRLEYDQQRQGMAIIRSILRLLGINPDNIL